jgi:hypothetical protein
MRRSQRHLYTSLGIFIEDVQQLLFRLDNADISLFPTPAYFADILSYIACIMCPDGEGPGFVADKVGVEGANGKVIDAFVGAGVVELGDGNPLTIVADQQLART